MYRFFGALILLLLLAAPVPAMAQLKSDKNEYTPTPQALAALTVEQAGTLISQALPVWKIILQSGETLDIKRVKVGLSHIEITDENGHVNAVTLAGGPIMVTYGGFFAWASISVNGFWLATPDDPPDENVAKLADAFYVLQNEEQQEVTGDAGFAQVVADYRAANPKPALPEEARRFEVQAKGAIQDGDFADAAAYYGKALQIAPWWPGGHYNRAAVLVEIGEYQLAIAEMKRYLLLAPDAPDARASQDKIYDWERLENKTMTTAAPQGGRTSAPAKPEK